MVSKRKDNGIAMLKDNSSGDHFTKVSSEWIELNPDYCSSGDRSTLVHFGYVFKLDNPENNRLIVSIGRYGKVKSMESGLIVLKYYDKKTDDYEIIVRNVGEDGIKPNTWYKVKKGKFVEA